MKCKLTLSLSNDKTATLCYLKERVQFDMATKDKSPLITQNETCWVLPPYTVLFLFREYECLERNSK